MPGKDPSKTLVEGHLHFFLHGSRLKGEWLMVRLKPRDKDRGENWLLRKVADEHVGGSDHLVGTMLTSVTTGRTMAEIAANKPVPTGAAITAKAAVADAKAAKRGVRKELKGATRPPPFQAVQLATLADQVPVGDKWLHEMKYDGYRCLVAIGGGEARAYTRSGLDWSKRFASIVGAAASLTGSALIDGEAVVLDTDGRSNFQKMQSAIKGDPSKILFYAFDLLEQDGVDLKALPQVERKARLETLLGRGQTGVIRYSDHIVGRGEELLERFCAMGVEGLISKLSSAPYRGRRTEGWLKVKCTLRQEFIIVGWLASDKQRGFRSLVLATRVDDKLVFAGKVGTGFGGVEMTRLMKLMQPLEQIAAPVVAPPSAVRGVHWIAPKLIAEIAYAEITGDGVLRHASYIGQREDKTADKVVLEKVKRTRA